MKFRNLETYPVNYIGQAYYEIILQLTRKEILGHRDPETLRILSLVNDVWNKFKNEDKFQFCDMSMGRIDDPQYVQKVFKASGIESDEVNTMENNLRYNNYVFFIQILEDYMKNGFSHSMWQYIKDMELKDIPFLSKVLQVRLNPSNEKVLKEVFSELFYNDKNPLLYELMVPVMNAGKFDQYINKNDKNFEPLLTKDQLDDIVCDGIHTCGNDLCKAEVGEDDGFEINTDESGFTKESAEYIESLYCEDTYNVFRHQLPVFKTINGEYIALSDVIAKISELDIDIWYDCWKDGHSDDYNHENLHTDLCQLNSELDYNYEKMEIDTTDGRYSKKEESLEK